MTIGLFLYIMFCFIAIVGLLFLEIKYPSEITTEFFNRKLFIIKKFVNRASKHFS